MKRVYGILMAILVLLAFGMIGSLAATPGNATCKANLTSCNGTCVDTKMDLRNCGSCGNMCPLGQHCDDSKCVCEGQLTYCKGTCIDTDTDELNCGACGLVCPLGTVCLEGGCWPSASYGTVEPEALPAVAGKPSPGSMPFAQSVAGSPRKS